jgi:hypothetical protein
MSVATISRKLLTSDIDETETTQDDILNLRRDSASVSLAAAANMSADGIAGPITLQTTQKRGEKNITPLLNLLLQPFQRDNYFYIDVPSKP